jgi:hypothetical protein
MNPVVLLVVGLFQKQKFVVGKDDVITSVLSKKLSASVNSYGLDQTVNFLFFVTSSLAIVCTDRLPYRLKRSLMFLTTSWVIMVRFLPVFTFYVR